MAQGERWAGSRALAGLVALGASGAIALAAACAPPRMATGAAIAPCVANGREVDTLEERLIYFFTETDAAVKSFRRTHGLDQVQDGRLAVVREPAVCSRAIQAYDRERQTLDSSYVARVADGRGVVVFDVGSYRAVLDPDPAARTGDRPMLLVFDREFGRRLAQFSY